ncbi:MAG: phosphoribosyltransferase [Streptosporangiaceae bacterium]
MTGRVFDHTHAWQMTSGQLARAASLLAAAATEQFGPADEVIAVARGGIQPAQAIAALLGVPLRPVRAQHNPTSALYTQATGRVSTTGTSIEPGSVQGNILIVDDICGTGATLHAVTATLTPLTAPGARLHTITLCRNAGASTRPSLTVWDNLREWVIFPWEPSPREGIRLQALPAPVRVSGR